MGDPEPATTIVIPVWGRYGGDTLREAVASLRSQDTTARILIVDNASDEPPADLEGVDAVRSPRRLTVGAARNLGLEAVRTSFVLFWDADDLMLPGTLQFLEERLRADSGLVAAAAAILGEGGSRHRWPPAWAGGLARHRRTFAAANSVWSMLPATGATLMRTDVARGTGGFADANSGEDWVLGVSLALRGRVEIHSRPGRLYRRRVGSLWEERRSTRHLLAHAAAVDRRLLTGSGIPLWGRLLVPLLSILQAAFAVAIRPIAKRVRSHFSHAP